MAVGATINWRAELPAIYRAARGQVALFCALVALRKTEGGGPGNEFGVLSVGSADTFDEELDVASRSLRNHVGRYERAAQARAYDPLTGLYTEAFLRHFSARYAPIGAENDPRGLNAHHADNLVALAREVASQLAERACEITL